VPEAGALLTVDGKEVGHVTRAARIWDPERVIAMAYVRREAGAVGTALQWGNGSGEVLK
jgi:glycine cleavage system aminomethyltransferase T